MMASPLVIYPELTAVVAPMLFRAGGVLRPWRGATVIDRDLRYDKRNKAVHRYDIADTRGALRYRAGEQAGDGARGATAGRPTWVSAHGRWWRCTPRRLIALPGVAVFLSIIFLNSRRFSRHAPLAEPEGEWWTSACGRMQSSAKFYHPAPIPGDVSNAVRDAPWCVPPRRDIH